MTSFSQDGQYPKLIMAVILFVEVLFFSQLPYISPKIATNKTVMTIFNGFSTGLFLGITFLHVIPEANQKLAHSHVEEDHTHASHDSHAHHHQIPYGSLIAILSFLAILTLEESFHDHGHNHDHHQHERKPHHMHNVLQQKSRERKRLYIETLLIQFALSLHCFFQCLSIGIESNTKVALTLGIAVVVHKWAEALTLGYSYISAGMNQFQSLKLSIIHSSINAAGVIIGYFISTTSPTLTGVLNGVAGGTFLYVCFIQKIGKGFKDKKDLLSKVGLILMGIMFTILIS